MSSFNNPHHFYLFAMKNGKRKLGYGPSPEAAFENLKLRLTPKEIEGIVRGEFIKIPQKDLQKFARELG
ncbi:MAG: hypothetical protein ACM3S0_02760 [Acidobacteriota bacterium]